MRTFRTFLLATGCMAGGIAAATVAFADTTPAATPASGAGIGDIVVTAQKRESTAQKTAVAMTVLDAKALERNGVQNVQDIAKLAPSVSIGTSAANTIIAIRGVSSRDTTEIADPAVAVSIDGFSIQRPTGLADSVYDLERVEVLRGPQGTLYGRSATGGAINFITAKPVDQLEGKVSVGYGNYNAFTTEGMINVPVTDTLQVRAAVASDKHDGYRTNETPATPGDDADTVSGRLSVLWHPIERFKLLVMAQDTRITGVGPTAEGYAYTKLNDNFEPHITQAGVPHSLPTQWIDTSIASVQWNASYDLDFASAIYDGGYRDMHFHENRDLDGDISAANYYQPNENPRDWQHELRLVSSGNTRFKWQLGANYFHETNSLLTWYQSYANSSSPTDIFTFDYNVTEKSIGVFGQASYQILPTLTIEGGTRYSHDQKARTGYENLGGSDIPEIGDISSSKETYHAALDWQATSRNLVYIKYDTGYKPGGFTDVFGQGVFNYQPETIQAYEIGTKNQFFDRRLQINLDAFHYNYENQQVSVTNHTAGVGNGTSYTINAGRSKISGIEIESQARITPDDHLDLSIAWLHARYTSLCTVYAADGSCTTNFSGNRSVQAPDWTVNAGLEHVFHVLNGTLTPRIQTHYESKSYLGIENYGYERQAGYTRSDAMITYTAPGGRWTLEGYVRNLENSVVITSASSGFGAYSYNLASPRTFGGKLSYNF